MNIENTIGKCSACGFMTRPDDPRIGGACDRRVVQEFKDPKTGFWDQRFVRCDGVITRHRKP